MAANKIGERRATDAIDNPAGILTDAAGNPMPVVLAPGARVGYERKMAVCKAAWEATGDPAIVAEAQIQSYQHGQPPPLWLCEAVCALIAKRRTKTHVKRAFAAIVRWLRFEAVRDAHVYDHLSWAKAKKRAIEELAETPAATSKPGTIWKAYKRVTRDLREGRGSLYLVPRDAQQKAAARRKARAIR
jgi:hypothetical protein